MMLSSRVFPTHLPPSEGTEKWGVEKGLSDLAGVATTHHGRAPVAATHALTREHTWNTVSFWCCNW
jgi:hypothetical protein